MPPPPTPQSATPQFTARDAHPASSRSGTPGFTSVLRHLDSPTLDLASTLSIHTVEDEANDANVSFLRTHIEPPADQSASRSGDVEAYAGMTSDEETAYFTRALSQLEGQANSLRAQLEYMERSTISASTIRRETSGLRTQRERQEVIRRTRELEDRARRERLQTVLSRLNRIDNPAYGDRVPDHNSLYDWSPATDADATEDSRLRAYVRNLRRHAPSIDPEILRTMAQTQINRERAEAPQPLQNGAETGASNSGEPSGLRHSPASQLSRDHRSMHRQFRSINRGDTGATTAPGVTNQTSTSEEYRAPARNVSAAYQRIRESRNRRSNLSTQVAITAAQDSRCQAPSSESNTWFHQAILYLASLRQSISLEESLRYATESGFAIKAFLNRDGNGDRTRDFVLDLWGLPPPAPTSLLAPGTIFAGMQRGPDSVKSHFIRGLERWLGPSGASAAAQWQSPLVPQDLQMPDAPAERRADIISAARLNSLPPLEALYPQRDWLSSTENLGVASAGIPATTTTSYPALRRTSATDALSVADHIATLQRRVAADVANAGTPAIQASAGGVAWPVRVVIHAVDFDTMTLSAEMIAFGVPNPNSARRPPLTSSTDNGVPRPWTEPTSTLSSSLPSPPRPHNLNRRSISTFLEGEILDLRRTTLLTERFTSSPQIDATYWRKLEPFRNLSDPELASNLVSRTFLTELNKEFLLMRWKERCFVRPLQSHGHHRGQSGGGGAGDRGADEEEAENKETPSESTCGLTISGFYFVCLRRRDGNVEGFYYDTQSSPYQYLSLQREMGSGGVAWEFR